MHIRLQEYWRKLNFFCRKKTVEDFTLFYTFFTNNLSQKVYFASSALLLSFALLGTRPPFLIGSDAPIRIPSPVMDRWPGRAFDTSWVLGQWWSGIWWLRRWSLQQVGLVLAVIPPYFLWAINSKHIYPPLTPRNPTGSHLHSFCLPGSIFRFLRTL